MNNSQAFRFAVNFALDEIGCGYMRQPHEARFGITADILGDYLADFPDESIPTTIGDLTPEQATSILYAEFWEECNCDQLPPSIAFVVFCAAILTGPVRAMKWLQRLLGVQDDGIHGPRTIRALRTASTEALITDYLTEQQFHEMGLPHWNANRRWWTRRLFAIARAATLIDRELITIDHVREGSAPTFLHDRNI